MPIMALARKKLFKLPQKLAYRLLAQRLFMTPLAIVMIINKAKKPSMILSDEGTNVPGLRLNQKSVFKKFPIVFNHKIKIFMAVGLCPL